MGGKEKPPVHEGQGAAAGEEGEGNARREDYSAVVPDVAMPDTLDDLEDWRWYERTSALIIFSTDMPSVSVLSIRSATDPVRDPPVP